MNAKFSVLILVKYLKWIMYTKKNHVKAIVKIGGLIHVLTSIKSYCKSFALVPTFSALFFDK
jgi:hypothetical protein